jgi:hypothetical protein
MASESRVPQAVEWKRESSDSPLTKSSTPPPEVYLPLVRFLLAILLSFKNFPVAISFDPAKKALKVPWRGYPQASNEDAWRAFAWVVH